MIPVEDRGSLFGDGIYEGVRALSGKMFEWAAHAERMVNGLNGLRINFDAAQVNALGGRLRAQVENGLGTARRSCTSRSRGRRAAHAQFSRPPARSRRSSWSGVQARRARARCAMRRRGDHLSPTCAGSGATGRR